MLVLNEGEVRLQRDRTENECASSIATSGITQLITIKKKVLHDEIIVTSFTITPHASSPVAFPTEEHTVGAVGNC